MGDATVAPFADPAAVVAVGDDGVGAAGAVGEAQRVDHAEVILASIELLLDRVPRPYDLRHSFASLLLAEGRQPVYVAKQLGHSLAVLLSTYAHLIAEYEDAERRYTEHEGTKRQVGWARRMQSDHRQGEEDDR